MKCPRCGSETKHYTGSFFNTDLICMDCKEIECQHPMYEEAKEKEHQEVLKGNYNYEGIGLPDDYYEFANSIKSRS